MNTKQEKERVEARSALQVTLDIIEARRGDEKLALVKKENAEEYLRDLEDKSGGA